MRGPDPYAARDPYMGAGPSGMGAGPGGMTSQGQGGYGQANNGYNVSQHSGYSTPNAGGGGAYGGMAAGGPAGAMSNDMYSRRSPGPNMMGAGGALRSAGW
jgi:hypothetical protein